MFGRRFARRMYRGDWGDWTPPWAREEWRGPRGPRFFGPGGPPPWGPGREWFSPEQQALRSTAAEVARLFAIASRSAFDNPEKQTRLRNFLESARKELTDIIYGSSQQ